jgi:DNA-binding SARP family transcriptional activator/TolB-like protein/Tfp pilus assembly protein PilF
MTVQLSTFGQLRLIDKSGEDIAFPEKGLLALAYLLTRNGHRDTRESLARLFWGEGDTGAALTNLRKTISRVRSRQHEIGIPFIDMSGPALTAHADALQWDFALFADTERRAPLGQLRKAMQLMEGDFLPGFERTSAALAAWIREQRGLQIDALRQIFVEAVPQAKTTPDFGLIKTAALRLLESNPQDEGVQSILSNVHDRESRAVEEEHSPPSDEDSAPIRIEIPADFHVADIQRAVTEKQRQLIVGVTGSGSAPVTENALPAFRPTPRLVLLPPVSGGNQMNRMFADVLIEDVTIALCSLKTVSVVAPYTAAQISLQSDKASIFEKHAINYVLDTRFSDAGSERMLFTQLVYFGSDEVVWADRFQIQNDGLLTARREIASRIAGTISAEIELNLGIRQSYECNPEAYRSYLLGQRYLKHVSLPEVRRARKFFREALHTVPDFSPALSGLARTYFMEWLLTARGEGELLKLAEHTARRAVETDSRLASGHRELGVVRLYQREFDDSIEALSEAEKLSPHYANGVASFADTLVQSSKPEEGLKKIERGIELNPFCPDDYLWTAAGASYSSRQYELALSYIDRMKDRTPADRLSAASWAMLGDARNAQHFVRKTLKTHPDFELEKWMAMVPFKDQWQRDHYREGLVKAGY